MRNRDRRAGGQRPEVDCRCGHNLLGSQGRQALDDLDRFQADGDDLGDEADDVLGVVGAVVSEPPEGPRALTKSGCLGRSVGILSGYTFRTA